MPAAAPVTTQTRPFRENCSRTLDGVFGTARGLRCGDWHSSRDIDIFGKTVKVIRDKMVAQKKREEKQYNDAWRSGIKRRIQGLVDSKISEKAIL